MTPTDRQTYDLMTKAPGYLMAKVLDTFPQSANRDEREAMLRILAIGIRQYLAHFEAKRDQASGT